MSPPLSPDVLVYDLLTPGDPDISPDGTRIVYALHGIDPSTRARRSETWLCDVDGGNRRRLTPPELEAAGCRWSPDGAALAFTGSAVGGRGLFVVSAEPAAEPRRLTRHAQHIDELAWSPDGGRIAYTTDYDPDNPDEREPPTGAAPLVRVTRRIDFKEDGRGYVGDRRSHVFVVDVRTGERRRLTTEPFDHASPQWEPDGRRLAVRIARSDRGGAQLALVHAGSGETEPVTSPGGPLDNWAWSPAGDRLVYAADPEHTFQLDFFVYEVATGTTRRVTDDLGAELESHPVWLDEQRLLFHAIRGGASGMEVLDTDTGVIEVLARWESRNSGLGADRSRRFVVQSSSAPASAQEIAVYDRERNRSKTVTDHARQLLADNPPASWERLEVRNDEVRIEGWLLKPPAFDPRNQYPLVLDVHGGPTACHGYRFLAHQQCLATNGFLVLAVNPRGSSSYGRDFAGAVVRDWGGGDYRDLIAVLDMVVERSYVDPRRVGIFGISYGGYLTAWAISQSTRFRAAVCGEPIFDIESYYGTSDVGYNGLERHAGGAPHSDPQWYTAHSPSTFAHRTTTPTLIFHGEADQRCPIGQSEQMFVALKKAGCETEYVRYPGGSHMFFVVGPPAHRADFLTRTLGWFVDHLGRPAERQRLAGT
ncbi:MAG: prolyl oligopeptidase family serine peptidase [Nocardioidaceae bacterium]